jgi:hypothetical protein
VSDDEPLRRHEYFAALAEALEVPPLKLPPAWIARMAGSVGEMLARSQRVSNRKLREASEWRPRYTNMWEGWTRVVDESMAAAS